MRSSFKTLVSKTAITRWLKKEHTIFVLISNAKFKQLPKIAKILNNFFTISLEWINGHKLNKLLGGNSRSNSKQFSWCVFKSYLALAAHRQDSYDFNFWEFVWNCQTNRLLLNLKFWLAVLKVNLTKKIAIWTYPGKQWLNSFWKCFSLSC